MTCEKPLSRIVWLIRAPSKTAAVEDVRLTASLRKEPTRPIYLLFREASLSPQATISRLRDIYGPSGARFSVASERPGRLVICAWWCSETTTLENLPLSDGLSDF